MYAYLHVDSWAGRTKYQVRVIGETPKRYRVVLLEAIRLESKRKPAGAVLLVPKRSIEVRES